MDDFKEDLLDTVAVLKQTFKNIGLVSWALIFISILLWPIFYLLLSISFLKLVTSGLGTIYLAIFLKKNSNHLN